MSIKLKPIAEQVIVITGASSGIGLATARMAAKRGARLVLAARSRGALDALRGEIADAGGQALAVPTDVTKAEDVAALARAAIDRFGGFDTWVNDAGTGMYGRLADIPVEEMRKLFDVNVWGTVMGSQEALKHLRVRGGALINIGSVESDRAIGVQGAYSASKHAVKAFTDEFRVGIEEAGAPVAVTLVKPGAIDTPFPVNAKNYLDSEPQHVPPVYAADTVADAILHCATTPTRDIFVGSGAKMMSAMGHWMPGLTDLAMAKLVTPATESGHASLRGRDESGLDRPTERLETRGNYPGHVQGVSLYTKAAENPVLAAPPWSGSGCCSAPWRAGRRRTARCRITGSADATVAKALHIHLEARPGQEEESSGCSTTSCITSIASRGQAPGMASATRSGRSASSKPSRTRRHATATSPARGPGADRALGCPAGEAGAHRHARRADEQGSVRPLMTVARQTPEVAADVVNLRTVLAPTLGAPEADRSRQLAPVDRVEPAVVPADRHR